MGGIPAITASLLGHLVETVLGRYLANTLILMIGVGALASLFGITSAWVVSRYEFKGRVIFSWLLVLPAAMPAYIIAYAYTDFLNMLGQFKPSCAIYWAQAHAVITGFLKSDLSAVLSQ